MWYLENKSLQLMIIEFRTVFTFAFHLLTFERLAHDDIAKQVTRIGQGVDATHPVSEAAVATS